MRSRTRTRTAAGLEGEGAPREAPTDALGAGAREGDGDERAPSARGEVARARADVDGSSAGEDERRAEDGHGDAGGAARAGKTTWKLAIEHPLASHDGNAVLSPGPYANRRAATAALYDFECAQGRGVICDKSAGRSHTLKFICKCRDVQDAQEDAQVSTCKFSAQLQEWRGKKGDNLWYLTMYEPHDWGTCRSTARMSMDQLLADRRLVEIVQRSDGKMTARDIAALVRERHGVEIHERTAHRVRQFALEEDIDLRRRHASSSSSFRSMSACALVKTSCARVSAVATHARVDTDAIDAFIDALDDAQKATLRRGARGFDAALHELPHGDEVKVAYVLVVDAINFCFWPDHADAKEDGGELLEYEHVAGGVRRAVAANAKALDATTLASMQVGDLQRMLRWPRPLPNEEERVRLLREVGAVLVEHFDGSALNLVRAARGSAALLVDLVLRFFPGFRDSTVYKGEQVHFYKRAQIFVGDVWGAFGGEGVGQFDDICTSLTMFADYRVPVVLRECGILQYSEQLTNEIRAENIIMPNSEQEIEIRACTVEAVERIKHRLAQREGLVVSSVVIDWMLWELGEKKRYDSHEPHHRTLTIFY